MEQIPGRKRPRTEVKNVFVGRNPDTGRPYFRKERVKARTPEDSQPPTIDEFPPVDPETNKPLEASQPVLIEEPKKDGD